MRIHTIPLILTFALAACSEVQVSSSSSGNGSGGGSSSSSSGGSSSSSGVGGSSSGGGSSSSSGGGSSSSSSSGSGGCANCAQPWSHAFGVPGKQTNVISLAAAEDGSIVMLIMSDDPVLGGADVPRIIKFDPAGQILWDLPFPAIRLALDKNGEILVASHLAKGTTQAGGQALSCSSWLCPMVAKLDANGQVLWTKVFPLNDGSILLTHGIGVGDDGSIMLTGPLTGDFDFGTGTISSSGHQVFYVARLSPSGDPIWSKIIPGTFTYASSMAVDAGGNAVIAGYFSEQIDFGSGPVQGPPGLGSSFLARFDPAGSVTFSKIFPQGGVWVDVSPAGDAVLAGSIDGAFDLGGGMMGMAGQTSTAVARLTPAGGELWGALADKALKAMSPTMDASGKVWVTGSLTGSAAFAGVSVQSAGGKDVALFSYDATGAPLSVRLFGGAGDEQGERVVVDKLGSPVIAGTFNGSIDFGQGPLNVVGTSDVFIAKLAP